MPTAGNTHEIAQAAAPECRIVYVDNDPVVLAHARALLRSTAGRRQLPRRGRPRPRHDHRGGRPTLDFTQPVAVVLIDILNFLPDPLQVMAGLLAPLPSGSYLAVMQPTADEPLAVAAERWNQISPVRVYLRDRPTIEGWFTSLGLGLIQPGLVELDRWRPAPGDRRYPGGMPLLGAVARKP